MFTTLVKAVISKNADINFGMLKSQTYLQHPYSFNSSAIRRKLKKSLINCHRRRFESGSIKRRTISACDIIHLILLDLGKYDFNENSFKKIRKFELNMHQCLFRII